MTSAKLWRSACCAPLALGFAALWTAGCGGGGISTLLGIPIGVPVGSDAVGGGDSFGGTGGFFGGGAGAVDPCEEAASRKFISLSLRNNNPDDFIHYFLILVAFIDNGDGQNGAVCADDVQLYTQFGYELIAEGATRSIGAYCVVGPALVYFHRGGQFQGPGGVLASAIPPAQGSSPTFDAFFGPSGASVPVPNVILFHNPGTGQGANLLLSPQPGDVCTQTLVTAVNDCQQDAFYYVDEFDRLAGSQALGMGSGRRVPAEIQGSGCFSGSFAGATFRGENFQGGMVLAPPGVTAGNAALNQFVRSSAIEYIFIRRDETPTIPQLLVNVPGIQEPFVDP